MVTPSTIDSEIVQQESPNRYIGLYPCRFSVTAAASLIIGKTFSHSSALRVFLVTEPSSTSESYMMKVAEHYTYIFRVCMSSSSRTHGHACWVDRSKI